MVNVETAPKKRLEAEDTAAFLKAEKIFDVARSVSAASIFLPSPAVASLGLEFLWMIQIILPSQFLALVRVLCPISQCSSAPRLKTLLICVFWIAANFLEHSAFTLRPFSRVSPAPNSVLLANPISVLSIPPRPIRRALLRRPPDRVADATRLPAFSDRSLGLAPFAVLPTTLTALLSVLLTIAGSLCARSRPNFFFGHILALATTLLWLIRQPLPRRPARNLEHRWGCCGS